MSCPGVSKFTAEELAELREFDAAIDAGKCPDFCRTPQKNQKNLTPQENKKRRREYEREYYRRHAIEINARNRARYAAKKKALAAAGTTSEGK